MKLGQLEAEVKSRKGFWMNIKLPRKLRQALLSIKDIFRLIIYSVFPRLEDIRKRRGWRRHYDRIFGEVQDDFLTFMNWGYAPLDKQQEVLHLEPEDEPWRSSIQLYHHLTSQVDLRGLKVLEVGCGRGGGCNFIRRYSKPSQMIGVDLMKANIEFCSNKYAIDGLSFRQADAEALPFDDGSIDVVVNIESSHCYPDLDRFYREVARVLRIGGFFLYADFGSEWEMAKLKHILHNHYELSLIRTQDITANVVEALRNCSAQKKKMLLKEFQDDKQIQFFSDLARLEGSWGFNRFRDRMEVYFSFLLQRVNLG